MHPPHCISERAAQRQVYSTVVVQTVENGIREMGIGNWRKVVGHRVGWRTATREELILLG